jgi:uncharacterized protein YjaG (DUF416 family)
MLDLVFEVVSSKDLVLLVTAMLERFEECIWSSDK